MQGQPADFRLSKESIEISQKLERISEHLIKMLRSLRRTKIAMKENERKEDFEKIRIDERLR